MLVVAQVYRARLATTACLRVTAYAPAAFRKYSTPVDIPVPNKSKVWDSVDEAVKDVKAGDTLLVGGTLDPAKLSTTGTDGEYLKDLGWLVYQVSSPI